jgi:hypothetical protein
MASEQAPATTSNQLVPPSALVGAGLRQAVTGVVPPQTGEARIRESMPTVVGIQAGMAGLGKRLIRLIVTAPLGWLVLAPLFAVRIAPFLCKRYTLTNRRIMIQRGLRPAPVAEIALADVDGVRIVPDSVDEFFRSGDLEVISRGEVKMRLAGVSEPESFQRSILSAASAWAGKPAGPFLPASAAKS